MKVIVDALDNNSAVFLLELLQRCSFKEVQLVTDEYATKKPSDYFGTLSEEEGEKFKNYVNNSRLEWERSF